MELLILFIHYPHGLNEGFVIFVILDKRALIVYPQGCYEVEKLVLFLVKQLKCIGIYPLTNLTQGQRVGEEGESVVMINDFKRATYIIILCTEETCKYY